MADRIMEGIRVLDFTDFLAGPYLGMYFADMGADVIKIENLRAGGNFTRNARPRDPNTGISMYWHNLNRGKRCVALDLKTEEGKELFAELLKSADVLIENNRPGVMKRLGFGWEEASAINPRLVYASISGFGQTGRNAYKPGYDLIAQAQGGAMSVTGWPDGEATRSGLAVGDMFGALNAGIGICASLYRRQITGKGNYIDVALVDSIVSAMEAKIMTYFNENHKIYGRWGNKYSASSPYDSFSAKDTTFVIASGTDKHWAMLCDAMGKPELKDDPRFIDTETRKKNDKYLREVIHEWTADKTAAECVEIIDKAGVPAARIYNVEDVVTDPGIAVDREMIVKVKAPEAHPEAGENGELTVVGSALKMPLTPMQYGQAAKDIGGDNDEIFKELGFSEERLAELKEKHVIN